MPEISERGRVGKVEVGGGVVGEDPGEHRVLHQVVRCPTSQAVQLHQVLEVAQPALGTAW